MAEAVAQALVGERDPVGSRPGRRRPEAGRGAPDPLHLAPPTAMIGPTTKTFVADREDLPGPAWLERFRAGREEAARWYLGNAPADVPTAAECRTALQRHMPKLVPHYDHACHLVGDDQLAHRILSQYRPAGSTHGCSQAVWLGEGGPALVRNYDYDLSVITGRIELSAWSGRRVLATAQRPWGGCLDGMNDAGLVASLTLGGTGRRTRPGFAVILLLRYVLETCETVREAVPALCRIPVAQRQNVTLLDRTGAHATLFLGPDRKPAVTSLRACTNHQEVAGQGSSSATRLTLLEEMLSHPSMTLPGLVSRFLEPPLLSRRSGSTTAYTAVYRPVEERVDYVWPGKTWSQGFSNFECGAYTHDYGELED